MAILRGGPSTSEPSGEGVMIVDGIRLVESSDTKSLSEARDMRSCLQRVDLSRPFLNSSTAKVQGSHTDTLVEMRGLEPLTPCVQSRCSTS